MHWWIAINQAPLWAVECWCGERIQQGLAIRQAAWLLICGRREDYPNRFFHIDELTSPNRALLCGSIWSWTSVFKWSSPSDSIRLGPGCELTVNDLADGTVLIQVVVISLRRPEYTERGFLCHVSVCSFFPKNIIFENWPIWSSFIHLSGCTLFLFLSTFWSRVSQTPNWLWTLSVVKDGLELQILCPIPPEGWSHRYVSLGLVYRPGLRGARDRAQG